MGVRETDRPHAPLPELTQRPRPAPALFHGSDFILPINPHFYLISVELGWEQGVGERSQQLAMSGSVACK